MNLTMLLHRAYFKNIFELFNNIHKKKSKNVIYYNINFQFIRSSYQKNIFKEALLSEILKKLLMNTERQFLYIF